MVIAVAGVPGAGKSTMVTRVVDELAAVGVGAKLLPQDGYHYSRAQLARFADPAEAVRRRGAPFTFDSQSFVETVEQLKGEGLNGSVWAPLFDHSIKDPVENDICIGPEIKVVFVEGNYVGLEEAPWDRVHGASDEYWFVDTAPELVRERLIARHLALGVAATAEEAAERCDGLDGDNAEYIRSHLRVPDVVVDLG